MEDKETVKDMGVVGASAIRLMGASRSIQAASVAWGKPGAVGQALSRVPGGVSHGAYGEWKDEFLNSFM